MGSDFDHRRAVAKYIANPQLDALAAGEGLASDQACCYRAWRTVRFIRALALVQALTLPMIFFWPGVKRGRSLGVIGDKSGC
jgi:hypothetical protein